MTRTPAETLALVRAALDTLPKDENGIPRLVDDPADTGRFRPCLACGRSPDVHNSLKGRDYIGHAYR